MSIECADMIRELNHYIQIDDYADLIAVMKIEYGMPRCDERILLYAVERRLFGSKSIIICLNIECASATREIYNFVQNEDYSDPIPLMELEDRMPNASRQIYDCIQNKDYADQIALMDFEYRMPKCDERILLYVIGRSLLGSKIINDF